MILWILKVNKLKRKQQFIRVTSVLDYVESKWKEYWWRKVGFEAADRIGKDSAAFGTRVHQLIGEVLLGETVIDGNSPEEKCAFEVLQYLGVNKVTPLFKEYHNSLEIEVSDKKLGLVGHFDFAALVNGVPCIIDFKTSNQMRKSFPLQKAAYAKMANKQFGIKIDTGITLRSHWNPETQTVEFEEKIYHNLIKTYWPLFNNCLSIYKYFTRKEQ